MVPLGYHFKPTDEEIVEFCLMSIHNRQDLPAMVCGIIHCINIYDEAAPWEIAAQFPESQREDFYIYTLRKKRSTDRMLRTSHNGKGMWRPLNTAKDINGLKWGDEDVVGSKKLLSFMADADNAWPDRKRRRVCSHWNIYEYSVTKIGNQNIDRESGYAICHVIYHGRANISEGPYSVVKALALMPKIQKDDLDLSIRPPGQICSAAESHQQESDDHVEREGDRRQVSKAMALGFDTSAMMPKIPENDLSLDMSLKPTGQTSSSATVIHHQESDYHAETEQEGNKRQVQEKIKEAMALLKQGSKVLSDPKQIESIEFRQLYSCLKDFTDYFTSPVLNLIKKMRVVLYPAIVLYTHILLLGLNSFLFDPNKI